MQLRNLYSEDEGYLPILDEIAQQWPKHFQHMLNWCLGPGRKQKQTNKDYRVYNPGEFAQEEPATYIGQDGAEHMLPDPRPPMFYQFIGKFNAADIKPFILELFQHMKSIEDLDVTHMHIIKGIENILFEKFGNDIDVWSAYLESYAGAIGEIATKGCEYYLSNIEANQQWILMLMDKFPTKVDWEEVLRLMQEGGQWGVVGGMDLGAGIDLSRRVDMETWDPLKLFTEPDPEIANAKTIHDLPDEDAFEGGGGGCYMGPYVLRHVRRLRGEI